MTVPDNTIMARATAAVVAVHESEMCAFLSGEVPANVWRPEKYAEAVLTVVEQEGLHRWWRILRDHDGERTVVWEGVDDEDAAFAALERLPGITRLEMRDALNEPWECLASNDPTSRKEPTS